MRRRGRGFIAGGARGAAQSAKRLHVCDNCGKKKMIKTYNPGDFDKGQQEVKCLPLSAFASPLGCSPVCSLKTEREKKKRSSDGFHPFEFAEGKK